MAEIKFVYEVPCIYDISIDAMRAVTKTDVEKWARIEKFIMNLQKDLNALRDDLKLLEAQRGS